MKNLKDFVNESNDTIKIWLPGGDSFEVKNTKWFVYLDKYNNCYKVNDYGDILVSCGCGLMADDFEDFGPEDIVFQSDDLKECVEFILRKTCDNEEGLERLLEDIKSGVIETIDYDDYDGDILLDKYDVDFDKFWSVRWALCVIAGTMSEEDSTTYQPEPDEVDTFTKAKKLFREQMDCVWGE